ncbi:MAG: histidine phosphatase family protein, partial [Kamptonema sp. SIO4C4]|nr:histidine phosphatase family protein [Kamptonema sp. SIO4C4]
GGERGVDLARRGMTVVRDLQEQYTEGNVLIVAHKTMIRVLVCSLLGIDVGRFRDRIFMPVCCITAIQFRSAGPLLLRMADQCHLEESLRSFPEVE